MRRKQKKIRLTKKKATELFKRVFGSSSNMYRDETMGELYGGAWCVDFGNVAAMCYAITSGHLVLRVDFDSCFMKWLYYNPDTLEVDSDYQLKNDNAGRKEEAFEYMACHGLAVVSMKDAERYDLEQIYYEG